MKKILFLTSLLLITTSLPAQAENTPPVLVVDKCPEFCPKTSKPSKTPKPPKPPKPAVEMCTQALIPVPNRPGYWYTDGCKKTIIKEPIKNKKQAAVN